MSNNQKEITGAKIILLIIDKLFIAIIIAGAGFGFNYLLQQEKIQSDYQKQLFERRVQSYIDILERAKEARDLLAGLYNVYSKEELGELQRRQLLKDLSWKAKRLGNPFSVSEGTYIVSYDEALEPLIEIEKVTRDADLYISENVKKCIAKFLDIVMNDLSQGIQNAEQHKTSNEKEFEKAAWRRFEKAYRELREELKHRLDLEGMPIG